ncbi:MAG TPA: hypothetical protein PLU25_16185, partial [Acidobacteriota bacterium]|nr:hypothetical protein [Acidobacteriota bacterium]
EQKGVTSRIPVGGIEGIASVLGCVVGHALTLPAILGDLFSDVKRGVRMQPVNAGSAGTGRAGGCEAR